MRGTGALATLLVATIFAAGCGGDDGGPGSDVTLDDLVGTWDANAFTFTNRQNPSQRVDLIAGGGDASLTIGSAGAYSLVVLELGGAPDVITGFAVIESGFLLVTDDDQPGTTVAFAVNLSGNALTLVTDESTFDFDDNGTPEPATLTMSLRRAAGTAVGDLAGTWNATVFRYISEPTESDTVDIIALGGSLTITITASGRYEAGVQEPDELPILETGTIVVSGGRLFLIDDQAPGDPAEFTFQLTGPDTLVMDANEDYDFGGGSEEPATLELVLERQA